MVESYIPWIAIVEVDGEKHVLKAMGIKHKATVQAHIQQVHPGMKILELYPADDKDPIAHIERVAQEHREQNPEQEPLTPERLTASANAARGQGPVESE